MPLFMAVRVCDCGAKLRHSWSLAGCGEWQEMYGVDIYAAVRLAVVDEGLSHSRRAVGSGSPRWSVSGASALKALKMYTHTSFLN